MNQMTKLAYANQLRDWSQQLRERLTPEEPEKHPILGGLLGGAAGTTLAGAGGAMTPSGQRHIGNLGEALRMILAPRNTDILDTVKAHPGGVLTGDLGQLHAERIAKMPLHAARYFLPLLLAGGVAGTVGGAMYGNRNQE